MHVSQQDIAKRVGVSQGAVSIALSGRPGVNEDLRRRIQSVARQMGYRANSAARAVRQRRYNTIGMVARMGVGTIQVNLDRGFSQALARRQMHAAFLPQGSDEVLARADVTTLMRLEAVDGLIVHHAASVPAQTLERWADAAWPIVVVNDRHAYDCVYPDDAEVFARVTGRLIELGHRRVGYLRDEYPASIRARHYSAIDRPAAAQSVLKEAGLELQRWFVTAAGRSDLPANFAAAQGQLSNLQALLQNENRPTALLVDGFGLAQRLVLAAAGLGLRVPQDLSVVTVSPFAVTPGGLPLSAMELPMRPIAEAAVEAVLQKVSNPHVRLPSRAVAFSEVVEVTMGPPPAGARA